ncbi:unnamed protein product [Closterium sp. Yama58-4]|nr:unnamed protein product [Closterium sp. Yama58-4]
MAEREMRTVVESVRTMLLHMGVQHHWWHLALRQVVRVCNCLERSKLPPGTTPYQLLTGKKPDLSLARVWGCMAQFLILERQRGGKLKPKARWGLHLGVSEESKGWELLDIADNRVVTTSDVVFYETMSLEVWRLEHGPASGRMQVHPPTDTSTAALPLLAEVGEIAAEDAAVARPPSPSPVPPLVADLHVLTSVSASGDKGSCGALPMAPAKSIAGGRCDVPQVGVGVKPTHTGESPVKKPAGEQAAVKPTKAQSATRQSAGEPTAREKSAGTPTEVQQDTEGSKADDDEGEHSGAEKSTDSYVVEVQTGPRRIALSPKMGTWELVERPPGVNIMKNRWVLTTKYHIDDTVEREKARLVVKGFTQVYGADYDETYAPVSSYVTLRIFLSIVAVLDLNLMQLDMKNAFLQSKLDRVLYMYQPDYLNNGTGRVCKLLKSLYGLKQSPLLWYKALNDVLVGAGWKKSQVDEALYFKVGGDGVACWVLVYVDDLLAASSSTTMLKELKELLEATFELREIEMAVESHLLLTSEAPPAPSIHHHGHFAGENFDSLHCEASHGAAGDDSSTTVYQCSGVPQLSADRQTTDDANNASHAVCGSVELDVLLLLL